MTLDQLKDLSSKTADSLDGYVVSDDVTVVVIVADNDHCAFSSRGDDSIVRQSCDYVKEVIEKGKGTEIHVGIA
jgi:1,4-dihydroxy-2-naphthoyl-CoA synthase